MRLHQQHQHHQPGQDESHRQQYPIVIAGGGPCGLLTALTLLQSTDVNLPPIVIFERVNRNKLSVSNIGSGFDLSPTALDVLRNKLRLPIDAILHKYNGICVGDMKTKLKFDHTTDEAILEGMRVTKLERSHDDNAKIELASVFRAELQKMLLDALARYEMDENPILKCGITVTSYEYPTNIESSNEYVIVHLSNGYSLRASALLGCDGIHSNVRRNMVCSNMYMDITDPLHYCGMECWWGKTVVQPGSDLEAALKETKSKGKKDNHVWLVGNKDSGKFFMGKPATKVGGSSTLPSNNAGGGYSSHGGYGSSVPENFMWAYFIKKPLHEIHSTRVTGDSTRRGGCQPTLEEKQVELEMNTESKSKNDKKNNKKKDKVAPTNETSAAVSVNSWNYQETTTSSTARGSTFGRLSPTTIIDDYNQETIDRITTTMTGHYNAADVENDDNLLHLIMKESKVDDITRVAIYDRANLNVPYSDTTTTGHGRVALLGDAAHPLPPFLFGQGVNMALVDGYVCASLIIQKLQKAHYGYNDYNDVGKEAILKAIKLYDCKERRDNVNRVIKQARIYGNTCVNNSEGGRGSNNPLIGWVNNKKFTNHLSSGKWLTECILKGDKANHDFVKILTNQTRKQQQKQHYQEPYHSKAEEEEAVLDLGF